MASISNRTLGYRISDAVIRLRRSIAQRGLAKTLGNLAGRIRHGSPDASSIPLHDFDTEFGVDTSGMISGRNLAVGHAHDLYNTAYYGIAPSLFRALMKRWEATSRPYPTGSYTFIDFGSGKGRAVMLASELPFRSTIGVEINPELAEIARNNLQRWGHAQSPAQICCQDAISFEFPPGPCLAYLFNPFSGVVLKGLIDHIQESFRGREGELDLLYVNPEFEFLLYQNQGFARLWEQQMRMSPADAAYDAAILGAGTGDQYGTSGNEPCTAWRWKGLR